MNTRAADALLEIYRAAKTDPRLNEALNKVFADEQDNADNPFLDRVEYIADFSRVSADLDTFAHEPSLALKVAGNKWLANPTYFEMKSKYTEDFLNQCVENDQITTLRSLMTSGDDSIRLAVASHPVATQDILEELSTDENQEVRQAAVNNINHF